MILFVFRRREYGNFDGPGQDQAGKVDDTALAHSRRRKTKRDIRWCLACYKQATPTGFMKAGDAQERKVIPPKTARNLFYRGLRLGLGTLTFPEHQIMKRESHLIFAIAIAVLGFAISAPAPDANQSTHDTGSKIAQPIFTK